MHMVGMASSGRFALPCGGCSRPHVTPSTLRQSNLSSRAVTVQARHGMIDSLLWQPLPASPVVLGGQKPNKSQLSGQAVNFGKCFFGNCSGVQDKGPGHVVGRRGDPRGQANDGSVPADPLIFAPPSCRTCQHYGTHAEPHDSRLQCITQMTVKTRKRFRSAMPVAADCGSGLRSCSLSSSSAPHHFTTPWRTSMPRGFPFPSAPSSSVDIEGPSVAYAPVATQVMLLAQQYRRSNKACS